MAYQLKDGQGSLFKNDRKEKENQPDYRGELMINGELLEVAAWIKTGQKGKFMSLSAKPKEERRQRQDDNPYGRQPDDIDDGEIPF